MDKVLKCWIVVYFQFLVVLSKEHIKAVLIVPNNLEVYIEIAKDFLVDKEGQKLQPYWFFLFEQVLSNYV